LEKGKGGAGELGVLGEQVTTRPWAMTRGMRAVFDQQQERYLRRIP